MQNVATIVPDETDLLCEGCGYILNGLPMEQNCPECGKPIGQSLGGIGDHPILNHIQQAEASSPPHSD